MDFGSGSILFTLIGAVFLVVLAILWFCLPFAVFGLKPKMDALIAAQQETNRLLKAAAEYSAVVRAQRP